MAWKGGPPRPLHRDPSVQNAPNLAVAPRRDAKCMWGSEFAPKLRPRSRFVPFCMLAVPICPVLHARRPSEQTEMLPTFPMPRPLRPGRLSSPAASSHRNKQSRFRNPGEGASSCRRPGSPARSAGRARGARRRSSAGPAPRRCTRGFRNWSLRLDLRRGESCRGCCGAWLSARIRPYRLSAWATIRAW
jgi:hypothetical protein